MASVTVERTLMKSPPEIWSLLQDPAVAGAWLRVFPCAGLAQTAQAYESQPERSIAWRHAGTDGTRAATAIALKKRGWGTHVKLTADLESGGGLVDSLQQGIRAALEDTLDHLGSDSKRPTTLVSA